MSADLPRSRPRTASPPSATVSQNINKARVRGIDYELRLEREPTCPRIRAKTLTLRFLAGRLLEDSTTMLGGYAAVGTLRAAGRAGEQSARQRALPVRRLRRSICSSGTSGESGSQRTCVTIPIGCNGSRASRRRRGQTFTIDDNTIDSRSRIRISSFFYIRDASGGSWEASLSVSNLFDEDPPVIPSFDTALQLANGHAEQFRHVRSAVLGELPLPLLAEIVGGTLRVPPTWLGGGGVVLGRNVLDRFGYLRDRRRVPRRSAGRGRRSGRRRRLGRVPLGRRRCNTSGPIRRRHPLDTDRDRARPRAFVTGQPAWQTCARRYVAKNEPDKAIPYCTESLSLNDGNWRVYSNRSQAYFIKGMYIEAAETTRRLRRLPRARHTCA